MRVDPCARGMNETIACGNRARLRCSAGAGELSDRVSIPRVAIPATLLQTAGGKREGEVYVMERFPQHAGRGNATRHAESRGGILPFRPKGDGAGVQLVAKARTVSLTVPLGEPEDKARLSAAKQLASRYAGRWHPPAAPPRWANAGAATTPLARARLSQCAAEPFFAIVTDDGVHLVNRATSCTRARRTDSWRHGSILFSM